MSKITVDRIGPFDDWEQPTYIAVAWADDGTMIAGRKRNYESQAVLALAERLAEMVESYDS